VTFLAIQGGCSALAFLTYRAGAGLVLGISAVAAVIALTILLASIRAELRTGSRSPVLAPAREAGSVGRPTP
jgi:hypothetical protein